MDMSNSLPKSVKVLLLWDMFGLLLLSPSMSCNDDLVISDGCDNNSWTTCVSIIALVKSLPDRSRNRLQMPKSSP